MLGLLVTVTPKQHKLMKLLFKKANYDGAGFYPVLLVSALPPMQNRHGTTCLAVTCWSVSLSQEQSAPLQRRATVVCHVRYSALQHVCLLLLYFSVMAKRPFATYWFLPCVPHHYLESPITSLLDKSLFCTFFPDSFNSFLLFFRTPRPVPLFSISK